MVHACLIAAACCDVDQAHDRRSSAAGGRVPFIKSGRNHMLVLSRKRDQAIIVNGNVRIVLIEIRGDKVRLGIEAPKDVPVHRQEVHEAIERQNEY